MKCNAADGLFTKPSRLGILTVVVIAVEQKHTDNNQDDGSDQESPVLEGREEMDHRIDYKKNNSDPAGGRINSQIVKRADCLYPDTTQYIDFQ